MRPSRYGMQFGSSCRTFIGTPSNANTKFAMSGADRDHASPLSGQGLLAFAGPRPVRATFHPHAAFGGVAVDPAGEEGADGAGSALAAAGGPVGGEREIDVAVAPGAGDGEIGTEGSGPGAGDLVAVAVQVHRRGAAAGVAGAAGCPRTGDVGTVPDRLWGGRRDAHVREMRFLVRVAPETDGTVEVFAFQTVHDETRFRRSVQVERCGAPGHFDSEFDPRLERQRLVRLIDRRPFAAEPIPAEVRL